MPKVRCFICYPDTSPAISIQLESPTAPIHINNAPKWSTWDPKRAMQVVELTVEQFNMAAKLLFVHGRRFGGHPYPVVEAEGEIAPPDLPALIVQKHAEITADGRGVRASEIAKALSCPEKGQIVSVEHIHEACAASNSPFVIKNGGWVVKKEPE